MTQNQCHHCMEKWVSPHILMDVIALRLSAETLTSVHRLNSRASLFQAERSLREIEQLSIYESRKTETITALRFASLRHYNGVRYSHDNNNVNINQQKTAGGSICYHHCRDVYYHHHPASKSFCRAPTEMKHTMLRSSG